MALNIAQELDGISKVKRDISTKDCFYCRVSFTPDMNDINKPKLLLGKPRQVKTVSHGDIITYIKSKACSSNFLN